MHIYMISANPAVIFEVCFCMILANPAVIF